jgi:DNA ligase-1
MKTFATLVNKLDSTNKTTHKVEAIIQFIQEADDKDKLWFLALFTGKRPKRSVNITLLKEWALEIIQLPDWLFRESYSSVGDFGETIALMLPPPTYHIEQSLAQWMDAIIDLKNKSDEEKKAFVLKAWDGLDTTERFIFNKLLGGSFRLGVSSKTLINAFGKHFNLEATAITHSIMGKWDLNAVDFDGLIHGQYTDTESSKPYPFCLAYPLEVEAAELGAIEDWQIEYKWDGIRSQIIKRDGEAFIWSRGEELINVQFPEIVDAALQLKGNFVMDGEMLAYKDDAILNFSELQKRLNRKSLTKRMLEELPAKFYAYDLMELEGDDLRTRPLSERRALLEQLMTINQQIQLDIPPILNPKNWEEAMELRLKAREINSEGLMLKARSSMYHSGRKRGDWWKWKIDALTIDAVLIYAQKGSGRRSAYYTDYTFAVKSGDQLVPIAKAYSGLTDKEIQEVSRFVNKNAIEKFGPVRTVKPELVFEIAFEGIGFSTRHKSGVALRFPRIARWRKDKTAAEIDDIEEIKKLIK